MSKSWDSNFEKKALAAANYRQFMGLFFDKKNGFESPRAMSFQQFSQRSGFASKSFAADILAGRKKITPLSVDKIILGLSLNKVWAEYFRALVAMEEPRFWNEKIEGSDYKKKCDQIRNRLLKKGTVVRAGISQQAKELEILALPNFPMVFSALGSLEKGARFEEIMKRT
ncbi:MAG: TIGR02147 family protein, partial [Bdellovibrionales bacterium]